VPLSCESSDGALNENGPTVSQNRVLGALKFKKTERDPARSKDRALSIEVDGSGIEILQEGTFPVNGQEPELQVTAPGSMAHGLKDLTDFRREASQPVENSRLISTMAMTGGYFR
jgi:hypothetical protein